MVHAVEQGLGGITAVIGTLLAIVWLLAALVLAIAFRMVIRERRREFAILRIAGAQRGLLMRMMLTEAVLLSGMGGAAGVLAGAGVLLPFAGLMKESLMRPYLVPDLSVILLLGVGALVLTVLSAAVSAAWTMRSVTAGEMDEMLREDG